MPAPSMRMVLAAGLLGASCAAGSADVSPIPDRMPDPLNGPEETVTELYDLVSFGPGETPDWDRVRALFVPEAVIVLRTGREETTVFSLEGFVEDFVAFIERSDVTRTGFVERILDLDGFAYGDIAHVRVRFDSRIPCSDRPPQEGIDGFHLIRRGGRWAIASIVNERPSPQDPPLRDLFRPPDASSGD